MKPSRKLGAIGAAIALAATSLVAAMPAGADTFTIDSPLGGGLILSPAEGDAVQLDMTEGSTIVGSYDNDTGAVEATVTFEPGIAEVDPGLGVGNADLYFEIQGSEPITNGTLDADGNLSFVDTKSIQLEKVEALGGAIVLELTDNCRFGPLDLAYEGTYDFDTGAADVLSAPVSVDPVPEGACGDLTDVINDMLAGASARANLTFSFAAEPPSTEEPVTKLTVLTEPAVASQITIDGMIADTWGAHDIDVSPGEHEVCFSDVDGYDNPGCQTVTVAEGESESITGTFTPHAMLNVTTEPAVNSAITIDGNPANNWGVHGVAVSPGEHEVCFGDVADFAAPDCETVVVTSGSVASVTGQFTSSPGAPGPEGVGMLRVETTPAVASAISIDGVVADTWGIDWLQLTPGEYEVCFGDLVGMTSPGCETVTVTEDSTTTVTGAFEAEPIGYLDVRTEPALDATISVFADGNTQIAQGNWGMDLSLPAGDYEVCFGDDATLGAPADPADGCMSVTVTAGDTTTATASYQSIAAS